MSKTTDYEHFYAYKVSNDPKWMRLPIYDRTFGSEAAAQRWVNQDPGYRFYSRVALKSWY